MELQTHHVGMLVNDIGKALERYTRLGYAIRTEIIHEPLQTAYVQFLSLPGESVYLELVAPDGPESYLTNALKKGGGINHICYVVRDIQASLDWLGSEGFQLIRRAQPAVTFGGRPIAWAVNRDRFLVELVEQGQPGEL